MPSVWIDECDAQRRCVDRKYCGLSPEIAEATFCVIFQAFSDGTETDERYIVAGYVASLEDWNKFSPKWHDILKERPRLGYYRTSDALALESQFKHFDEKARNERITALASVIPNTCSGVMASVSKADFKEFFTPSFNPIWDDPHYLCATYLIEHLCWDMHAIPKLEKLDFIFDRQGKVGLRFKAIYDVGIRPMSMLMFPFLGNVSHESKTEFLPLQAADMQAGWMRRSASTIQTWTSADVFLSQIPQRQYPISRKFLERIAEYKREHSEEIAAFWAEYARAEAARK
jgi:hypothetical protein